MFVRSVACSVLLWRVALLGLRERHACLLYSSGHRSPTQRPSTCASVFRCVPSDPSPIGATIVRSTPFVTRSACENLTFVVVHLLQRSFFHPQNKVTGPDLLLLVTSCSLELFCMEVPGFGCLSQPAEASQYLAFTESLTSNLAQLSPRRDHQRLERMPGECSRCPRLAFRLLVLLSSRFCTTRTLPLMLLFRSLQNRHGCNLPILLVGVSAQILLHFFLCTHGAAQHVGLF